MATVRGNARLARHVADIDDDGHHAGTGSYTAHGNTGATETFDAGTLWHSATLDSNSTFTFTGATSGVVAELILELLQDGTGSRIVTWPGSVVWPGGSAPTLSTTPATTDILLFESRDGGTVWYGYLTGSGGSSVAALDDLSDVVITSATLADRLRFDGTNWVNSALIWRPMTVYDPTTTNWLPLVDGSGNQIIAEA